MVQKICPDCGLPFEYEPNPNFRDNRKYCDGCGAKRKAQYEAAKKSIQQPSQPQPKPIIQTQAGVPLPGQIVQTQIQIVRNERPNYYEFGRAGNRFKLYFSDKTDLQEQLDSLLSLRVPPELLD